jgi:hypothetical protein
MKFPSLLKSVFIVLALFAIGTVAYHKYSEYKRYQNISRFDYLPGDSIDYAYYDQAVLNTYLANCNKLSDLAKAIWLDGGIDIHANQTGHGKVRSEINQYKSLLKYTNLLEDRLSESKDLKDQGLSNDVIEMVLDKGITVGAVENEKDKIAGYDFLKGKNVSLHSPPNEIWELQKLLNANDYNISINGVFDLATDSALLDFQRTGNLYPSHVCDDLTLRKLTE